MPQRRQNRASQCASRRQPPVKRRVAAPRPTLRQPRPLAANKWLAPQVIVIDTLVDICRTNDDTCRSKNDICRTNDDTCRTKEDTCSTIDDICLSQYDSCRTEDDICRTNMTFVVFFKILIPPFFYFVGRTRTHTPLKNLKFETYSEILKLIFITFVRNVSISSR